jgi:predicted dienelactone hydrolase
MDRTVLFSDGTTFTPDTLLGPAPDPSADARTSLARTNDFLNTVAFPIWIDDSRFVLDKLEVLNRTEGPFRGRLDLDRVGMLGWSFGGAAALEMLRTDPRVKAAVNHDGRLFGGTMTRPIGRPFMMFHHGINDLSGTPAALRAAAQENLTAIFALDSAARARATSDWYDVTIARTNHGHFSDLPLFLSLFQDASLLGAQRDHEIISAYTVAFFDRYLRGRASPLLEGTASPYSEATFHASKSK